MSDNILKLIPVSPTYIPGEDAITEAVALLQKSFSSAEHISVEISDLPRFVDQGANWERIICPECNSVIDPVWWQSAMDEAFDNRYRNLVVQVPCCKFEISLNDLRYEWPAGFAQFSIEIRNPGKDVFQSELKELEVILGSSLRKIWAHY
jgi:hypothetical protein